MRTVRLTMAFSWVCPNCKAKCYADLVDTRFTPEEYRDACIELGVIEPHEETPNGGELMMAPASVTCSGCLITFATEESVGGESSHG